MRHISAALSVETRSMADDEHNSGGAGEPPRRRRVPPPTIDLEATDVSAPSEPTATAPDPAPSETSSAAPSAADAAPGEAAAASPPVDDPTEEPPHAVEAPPAPAGGERRALPIWSFAAAGLFGAVLALIIAGGVWALLGPASDQQADMNARLSRIETQLGGLSRPAPGPGPGAGDHRSLDELTQRLGRIESTLEQRLGAVDREIKPLADRLADVGRRDDEAVAAARLARERAEAAAKSLSEVAQQLAQLNAARANAPAVERADLDALATRLAGLEASTKQIGQQLTGIANASSPGNTQRAVVALALNAAVERGGPYARELAALDPAAAGPGALDALKTFADTGVPSAATLARELAAVMPAALKAADAPASGGLFERLQSNAERLVRIRPVAQEPQGGDPAATLGRVEVKTAHGDIAGALAEAAKLPATVRAPLEPWLERAQAREAALSAAAALAAQSLDVIRRPSQGNP
jgi:hypothetical protein